MLLRDVALRERNQHGRDYGRELSSFKRKRKSQDRQLGREAKARRAEVENTYVNLMESNSSSKHFGTELLQEDLKDLKLEAGEDADQSEDVVGGKRLKNVLLSGKENRPLLTGNSNDSEDWRKGEGGERVLSA